MQRPSVSSNEGHREYRYKRLLPSPCDISRRNMGFSGVDLLAVVLRNLQTVKDNCSYFFFYKFKLLRYHGNILYKFILHENKHGEG